MRVVAAWLRWIGLCDPCGTGHVWAAPVAFGGGMTVRRCVRCHEMRTITPRCEDGWCVVRVGVCIKCGSTEET